MSSPHCTDNVSLNEFNLTSLENPSLSIQGNVNLFITTIIHREKTVVDYCSFRNQAKRGISMP